MKKLPEAGSFRRHFAIRVFVAITLLLAAMAVYGAVESVRNGETWSVLSILGGACLFAVIWREVFVWIRRPDSSDSK